MENIIIRKINENEMPQALDLVWRTFLEYEAPDYTEEGIAEFKRSIDDKEWLSAREFFGAFIGEQIVGMICTKNKNHIALFFVDGKYHRNGIGRQLFEMVTARNEDRYFTVNSSPYAKEVYQHLGFELTNQEQLVNGLKFYPMKKVFQKESEHTRNI